MVQNLIMSLHISVSWCTFIKHMDFTFDNLRGSASVWQLVHGQILTWLILVLFCFQKKSKYVSIARGGYQGMLLLLKLGHG